MDQWTRAMGCSVIETISSGCLLQPLAARNGGIWYFIPFFIWYLKGRASVWLILTSNVQMDTYCRYQASLSQDDLLNESTTLLILEEKSSENSLPNWSTWDEKELKQVHCCQQGAHFFCEKLYQLYNTWGRHWQLSDLQWFCGPSLKETIPIHKLCHQSTLNT